MALTLLGSWDGLHNIPYITNGVGNVGDCYLCTVAGSQNLGNGSISYRIRDTLVYTLQLQWIVKRVQYSVDIGELFSGSEQLSPLYPSHWTPDSDVEYFIDLSRQYESSGTTGTVTQISTLSPLVGGPITNIGTISIPKSTNLVDGYLSAVDWSIFNSKQPAGSYLTIAVLSLNGLTGTTQTFINDTNIRFLSSGTTHGLTWAGTLADSRISSAGIWNAKQNALANGIGISIAGGIVTNTLPDQTVILNQGTGIQVIGTYPNFTILTSGTTAILSIATTNGLAGTVSGLSVITLRTTVTGLLKGDGTSITAAIAGTDYLTSANTSSFLLSTTTGIDATIATTYNLYTVPSGKITIVTTAVIRVTTATVITGVPTVGIGIALGESDIFAATALTGVTATNKVFTFTGIGTYVTGNSGNIIKLGIDVGATASTMIIAIDLFGYNI